MGKKGRFHLSIQIKKRTPLAIIIFSKRRIQRVKLTRHLLTGQPRRRWVQIDNWVAKLWSLASQSCLIALEGFSGAEMPMWKPCPGSEILLTVIFSKYSWWVCSWIHGLTTLVFFGCSAESSSGVRSGMSACVCQSSCAGPKCPPSAP